MKPCNFRLLGHLRKYNNVRNGARFEITWGSSLFHDQAGMRNRSMTISYLRRIARLGSLDLAITDIQDVARITPKQIRERLGNMRIY